MDVMVEEVVKVTRKYQVTIPKGVREKVGIKMGDNLKVADKGDLIVLEKISKRRSLLDFAGCWRGYPKNPKRFMEEIRKMWSTWKV
ncbi:MAG: AbrB/MazE/SpoVT family DNA-binding domain-containing protein [Thermoproteota archaeon]